MKLASMTCGKKNAAQIVFANHSFSAKASAKTADSTSANKTDSYKPKIIRKSLIQPLTVLA